MVSKLPRLNTTITFSDADLEGCQHPHDDLLVIRVVVANKTVHRVLIDNGSLANIIFASTFEKMGIGMEKLEPVNAHLRGFAGVSTTGTHSRGIDPAVITHKLNVASSFKPVKHRKRSFAPERQKAINEEVSILL